MAECTEASYIVPFYFSRRMKQQGIKYYSLIGKDSYNIHRITIFILKVIEDREYILYKRIYYKHKRHRVLNFKGFSSYNLNDGSRPLYLVKSKLSRKSFKEYKLGNYVC